MRKVTTFIIGAAMLASAPVSAGEIAGNGKYVPGGANGASECSYSGLNDDPEEDGLGFTQTFAAVMKLLGIDPSFFNPGMFCRGNM